MHGFSPGISRVSIIFPASVLVLCLGPVGNNESLEDGSSSPAESNKSASLLECMGMEVLSVHMHLVMILLEEFVMIEVLNTHSYNIIIN